MTPDLIALFSSIGTCVSALATLWTVREMAKQRTSTYRPELTICRRCFHTKAESSDFCTWLEGDERDNQEKHPALLHVANVGLGSAKQIEVFWSFHVAEAVGQFNKLAGEFDTESNMRIDRGAIYFESPTFGKITSLWKNQQCESFDYLLPASTQRERIRLHIPHAYRQVVSGLLHLAFTKGDGYKILNLPHLDICITYADLGGLLRTDRFRMRVDIESAIKSTGLINGELILSKIN